eukprot:COSAG05_NODE_9666_length_608_cov_43.522593_1_plen_135_part_00
MLDSLTHSGDSAAALSVNFSVPAQPQLNSLEASLMRWRPLLALTCALSPLSPAHAQCNFAMLSELESILTVCCDSTEASDCSSGMPARCSPECAGLLVPYWDECNTMIQMMGDNMLTFELPQMEAFIDLPVLFT